MQPPDPYTCAHHLEPTPPTLPSLCRQCKQGVAVPQQTPLGIYSVPLIVTIREPSIATQTKPISTNTTRGVVDPKFELSKKFPTVGYLTKPVNFTVTVISPMTISEQFKDFWGTYGQFIGLFAGGFVGAYAKVIFDKRKKRHEEEH